VREINEEFQYFVKEELPKSEITFTNSIRPFYTFVCLLFVIFTFLFDEVNFGKFPFVAMEGEGVDIISESLFCVCFALCFTLHFTFVLIFLFHSILHILFYFVYLLYFFLLPYLISGMLNEFPLFYTMKSLFFILHYTPHYLTFLPFFPLIYPYFTPIYPLCPFLSNTGEQIEVSFHSKLMADILLLGLISNTADPRPKHTYGVPVHM
jgi:hypothetical protein